MVSFDISIARNINVNFKFLNEEHWRVVDNVVVNLSRGEFVLQIRHVETSSNRILFSTSCDQMRVVSRSWIRHRTVAAREQVAEIVGDRLKIIR